MEEFVLHWNGIKILFHEFYSILLVLARSTLCDTSLIIQRVVFLHDDLFCKFSHAVMQRSAPIRDRLPATALLLTSNKLVSLFFIGDKRLNIFSVMSVEICPSGFRVFGKLHRNHLLQRISTLCDFKASLGVSEIVCPLHPHSNFVLTSSVKKPNHWKWTSDSKRPK